MIVRKVFWCYLLLIMILIGCGQRRAEPIKSNSLPTSEISIIVPPASQTPSVTHDQLIAQRTAVPTQVPMHTSELTSLPELIHPELLPVFISDEGFAMGSYDHLWWSPDSRILYYYTDQMYFEYSIDTQESRRVPDESLVLLTSTPVISTSLPAEAVKIGISPRGNKALYLIPVGPFPTPMPTDPNEMMGEAWPDLGNAELWYLDGKDTHSLGIIEWCANYYIWSEDEHRVIVFADQVAAQCETQGWLIDLDLLEVTDLFPQELYHQSFISVEGISPNGQMVIFYGSKNLLYVKDLSTLNDTRLEIPQHSWATWYTDNSLFVIYRNKLDQSWSLGMYDLFSSTLEELFAFNRVPDLLNMRPNEIEISPDRKWVALITGSDRYISDRVWLMKIEVEDQPN